LTKHQSISLGLFKPFVLAGLLACVAFTEVRAEDACIPKLVTELFFSNGEVQPGIYLGNQKIGELARQVAENPRIKSFLSGQKDSNFVPLIVVGIEASSSNYSLQMVRQEHGVGETIWVQRRSSDIGLMVLGHPMWLGLWPLKCAETTMTVTYGE
jgi:hypothetical protein